MGLGSVSRSGRPPGEQSREGMSMNKNSRGKATEAVEAGGGGVGCMCGRNRQEMRGDKCTGTACRTEGLPLGPAGFYRYTSWRRTLLMLTLIICHMMQRKDPDAGQD